MIIKVKALENRIDVNITSSIKEVGINIAPMRNAVDFNITYINTTITDINKGGDNTFNYDLNFNI